MILSPTNFGKIKILDAKGYLQRSYVTGLSASGTSTFTVQSGKDTYFDNYVPDHNYNNLTFLSVKSSSISNQRSPLEFPVVWGTDIPAGATVDTAVLYLYYYSYSGNPVGRTYWAYRLTRTDWVEAEATWNIYKTGSSWSAGGGDYTVTNGASTVMPADYGWVSWNVLDQVKYAQTNSVNVEFLIKDGTEGSVTQYLAGFHSNTYAVDTTLRPKLIIGYTATTSTLTTHYNNIERLL
jgi:hypothetical protein